MSTNILSSVASIVSDTLEIPRINSPTDHGNLNAPKVNTPKNLTPWLQQDEPRSKTPRMQASIRDIRQVMSQMKQKEEEVRSKIVSFRFYFNYFLFLKPFVYGKKRDKKLLFLHLRKSFMIRLNFKRNLVFGK